MFCCEHPKNTDTSAVFREQTPFFYEFFRLGEQCKLYEQELESFKNKSQKSADSLTFEIEKLQFQRDSITSLYNQLKGINLFQSFNDYVHKCYTKYLPTKAVVKDKYWERGTYYESNNEGEMFYHVTSGLHNDSICFFFMGVAPSNENKDWYVRIYELNENKEVFVIDSFKIIMHIGLSYPKIDDYLSDFSHRNNDNLIVKNRKLYYYKEKEKRCHEDTYFEALKKKDYYEYTIGSKVQPIKIDGYYYSNNVQAGIGEYQSLINPSKSLMVKNDCNMLYFYQITNWDKALVSILGKGCVNVFQDESICQPLDFNFRTSFKTYYESILDSVNSDLYESESFFIGGFCWHSQKNIVYFDNSGVCYACIWKVDIENKRIEKIVPEHEAIQPHFFSTANQEYIAYVEENKIMLCKVPGGFEE